MKKIFLLCITMLTLTGICLAQNTSASSAIDLAQNGRTSYVIALASNAIPAEKTAAQQFQKYFQQITGTTIDIKPETAVAANAPQILVGAGDRVKALLSQQDWKSLGSDGIIIKTVGNNLILAGGRPRGTLYAVFQFLEDVAGCRWWTPTENTIPHKSTFTITPQNIVYVPPFNYREHFTNEVRYHPEFATILRENGHYEQQTAEWGGHYTMLGFVHTFSKLLPPEKYFKEHPEWYSDPTNGNKPCTASSKMPAAQNTQLCLSNPEVVEEMTKQVLAWIAENPDAGYISVSQNDGSNYCHDAASMELAEKEGSQAAPLIQFVNQIAEKVQQKYPDFLVETLAYLYTEKPPKTIRPAKNVIIRLAPIHSDFGHPLDSDWNKDVRDNLLEWSKIAPQLFVWNYVTNFKLTMLPHPNWAGLDKDLRFFAAHNVKGVFEQGDNYTNGVGDLVQLRAWLMGHLMWNPQLDQEQLIDEFMNGYYGAAGPYMKQYLDLLESTFLQQQRGLSTYNEDFSFLTVDTVSKAQRLLAQAADAVKDDKVLSDRVERDSLSLQFATLYKYNILKRAALSEHKPFPGPADPQAALQDAIKTALKFGAQQWSEGKTFNADLPVFQHMFAAPVELPDFAKTYPAGDVIDIQQDFFSLYKRITDIGITDDAAASDGKAAYMGTNSDDWAMQAHLGPFVESSDTIKWHVYAMVRTETTDDANPKSAAFSSGIYDVTNKKNFGVKSYSIESTKGSQYRRIDLGTYALNGGMYIYFVPGHNDAVQKIYVDRIILVREK